MARHTPARRRQASAQRRIALATPYFVPNEALTAAIIVAAVRGVEVRILAPKRSDSRLATAAVRSYYDELATLLPLLARLRPLLRNSFRLALAPFHDLPGLLDLLFQRNALGLMAHIQGGHFRLIAHTVTAHPPHDDDHAC